MGTLTVMGDASAGLLFIANCCGEMCWYGDKPKVLDS